MDEFDWIQTYLASLAGPEGLKLLDDAAVYTPSKDQDLILTQDTLVEGVHFFKGEYGAGTASRLMAVNLSDLAAKGARPVGYLLSVAWPKHLNATDLQKWMKAFTKGLQTEHEKFGFTLFGGDTVKTEGPMSISATFLGVVPRGEAVLRSGANIGDDIWVTGTIGDAYLGLQLAQKSASIFTHSPEPEDLWTWEEAFRHPTPRLLFRKTLRKYASACADISDGLISEAGHIAKASQNSLLIHLENVPLSAASLRWCAEKDDEQDRRIRLATNGDDYELLFTAKPEAESHVLAGAKKINLAVTKIGRVSEGQGAHCLGTNGKNLTIKKSGYSHD